MGHDTRSGVKTYRGFALIGSTETLHLGHLLFRRLVGHAGLLRAVATLLLLRVSSGGVLGVVGMEAVVVVLLLVEMKSGVRGAGLRGGLEGGRGDLLLR
jgi:hypothetical protein